MQLSGNGILYIRIEFCFKNLLISALIGNNILAIVVRKNLKRMKKNNGAIRFPCCTITINENFCLVFSSCVILLLFQLRGFEYV